MQTLRAYHATALTDIHAYSLHTLVSWTLLDLRNRPTRGCSFGPSTRPSVATNQNSNLRTSSAALITNNQNLGKHFRLATKLRIGLRSFSVQAAMLTGSETARVTSTTVFATTTKDLNCQPCPSHFHLDEHRQSATVSSRYLQLGASKLQSFHSLYEADSRAGVRPVRLPSLTMRVIG